MITDLYPDDKVIIVVGAYGRDASLLDWDSGQDFAIKVRPPGLPGGTYLSRRDTPFLRRHGVTHVILLKQGGAGFIVRA